MRPLLFLRKSVVIKRLFRIESWWEVEMAVSVEQVRESCVYEKPVFEKQKEMVFPREVVEHFNGGRFCVQCSGCHGCR